MRVLVPALAGFDLEAYPEYDDDELAAGLFVFTALSFYEAVDAHVTCNAGQLNNTIYYSFPHNSTNGLATLEDFSLECGAYGFYVHSNDLGDILGGLAASDDLLSDASWDLMREGQLGFMDPADGWFWGNGGLGLYHNHGGDWEAGIKGLDACVMLFPNGVVGRPPDQLDRRRLSVPVRAAAGSVRRSVGARLTMAEPEPPMRLKLGRPAG